VVDAVVLLSGGMDPLVCAAHAVTQHSELAFLHLNYGQKTSAKELECFQKIADHYSIALEYRKIIQMDFLKQIGGSSLTDDNIHVKKYDGDDSSSIPSSYVPFRNSIILSLAVSWAESLGAKHLYIGANFEDSPGYPDCRPEYYEAFNELVRLGTKEGDIHVHTPVIHMKKSEIVMMGQKLKAPFEMSWSCYAQMDKACGICDSCALRLRGFKEANVEDPIFYN
jgi:7-cyano-7-deazaguanine synthase